MQAFLGRIKSFVSLDLGAGVIWISMAAAFGQGTNLLAGVLIAKAIGPREFGSYSFLQSTLTTWSLVASLSSGLLATRYLAAYGKSDPSRAGQVLGHCTVASIVGGVIAAIALATSRGLLLGRAPAASLSSDVMIVALAVPIATFTLFQSGAMIGLRRFRLQALLLTAQSAAFIAGPLIGALKYGARGAMIGLASAYGIRVVTHGIALRRAAAAVGIRTTYRGKSIPGSLFLRFALPASLTGLTASGSMWYASLLLVSQPDGGYHMGLFSAALNFRLVVLFLPVQISTIGVTLLTGHLNDSDHSAFGARLRETTILTALAASCVSIVLGLFTNPLLGLFGPNFASARSLVHLLLFGAVMEAIAGAIYQALPSRDQMWRSLLMVGLPRDSTLLLAALILVPRFKSMGLGMALLLSQAIGLAGVVLARAHRSLPAASAA